MLALALAAVVVAQALVIMLLVIVLCLRAVNGVRLEPMRAGYIIDPKTGGMVVDQAAKERERKLDRCVTVMTMATTLAVIGLAVCGLGMIILVLGFSLSMM